MYSDMFCKIYNEFGWNYYPEAFGQQLLEWLDENGITPKSCIDLACGTGILCEIMHRFGAETWGMDFSEGMIAIAREGSKDIHYDVADMITYRPEKQFDLVTCTGDALNHIPELSDLKKIFENVYAYTAPGGHFIFDILNEKEVSTSEPFEMDYNENERVWFQMLRPAPNKVTLKIRVYENGSLKFEENINETIHDPETVCSMLCECGFKVLKLAHTLPDNSPAQAATWFVIAKKA
ncbi:MAG: class I SAM-dependent methyltransferase [Oscillospiraceae bacterium]|nr:class I SAM-dependent methyltransferase [Oscillospiraceae bacterium]